MDIREIKQKLNIPSVVESLLPSGKKVRNEWTVGGVDNSSGKSMSVNLDSGLWIDRATQEKGDIIGLWMAVKGESFKDAVASIKAQYGFMDSLPIRPKKTPPAPSEKVSKLSNESLVKEYLTEERGIMLETLNKYHIREHNGAITFCFTDSNKKHVMNKYLSIDRKDGKKKIWSTTPYSTLWGWWTTNDNTREIIITEGEIDAMSLCQMGSTLPVLSLPSGVSNLGWIENDYDRLCLFDKVYLCLDMDEAGQRASKAISERLGVDKCYVLSHNFKDANDMLLSPDADESDFDNLCNLSSATQHRHPNLACAGDYIEETLQYKANLETQLASNNFVFPYAKFRWREGEFSIITGISGHGKSQFAYQCVLDMLLKGHKVCVASFEIPIQDMILKMCQMNIGTFPSNGQLTEFTEQIADKLIFLSEPRGKEDRHRYTLDNFEYAHKRWGCSYFFLDSLHFITTKGDHEAEDSFAADCATFCRGKPRSLILTCHARKGKDLNVIPNMFDVMGSSGIVIPAYNVIVVWRNQQKEEELGIALQDQDLEKVEKLNKKHDAILAVRKQRITGDLFMRKLWFDRTSQTFRDTQEIQIPEVARNVTGED